MAAKQTPYGTWKSPITSDLIVAESISILDCALDGDDILWAESRPQEGGRSVVMRQTSGGEIEDLLPPSFNARTRVHEYGGGAWCFADDALLFSNFDDQHLYRVLPRGTPELISSTKGRRYADGIWDQRRQRLISVIEDHGASSGEAVNAIASIPMDGTEPTPILASGHDFFSSPCLSPDGDQLAWLSWDHPNMPWVGTHLWLGTFDGEGGLSDIQHIAGGVEESIFQPQWSPDGILYFVSDRNGWWNLYRYQGSIESICEKEAEFGMPQWVFRLSTYGFISATEILAMYHQDAVWRLARIDLNTKASVDIKTPYTWFSSLRTTESRAVCLAASPTEATCLVELDLRSNAFRTLRRTSDVQVPERVISPAEPVTFPTEGGKKAHAFLYRPRHADYAAPDGELPPLVVFSHGGPTSATRGILTLPIQYWTSRGFAVLDVNYGGSTGYGREYMSRLKERWGVVDVDDCVNGAQYLVEQGLVDGERMAIRGGSAGGYTTLAALTFRDVFSCGASYFGVSDIALLAQDTHKFESRYMDWLVGPYPEAEAIYRERSPLHGVGELDCPVIFFQGLEDKVVLPNQAELMVEALRERGIPVAYVPFEGEQHGFRKAENIKRSLDGELYFYGRIFGFDPADDIEPVPIDNLA
jgi:dipeptidyl aminopeptidase/acylaminoacyl peptidase